jgi:hypothetical protein
LAGSAVLEGLPVKQMRRGQIVWEDGRIGEIAAVRRAASPDGEDMIAVTWSDDGSREEIGAAAFFGSNKADWLVQRELAPGAIPFVR